MNFLSCLFNDLYPNLLYTPVLLLATVAVGDVLSSHFHGPTALPVVLHNGYLADTHEVAAAKSAHLATLSHQSQGGSHGRQGDSHYNQHGQQGDSLYNQHGHQGHIADTHEVAAAKAEHYAAVSRARAHGGYNYRGDYNGQYASGYSGVSGAHQVYGTHATYHGPTAVPHVLHDGHIADTREVAAAKAEHYAAVSRARAHGGYSHVGDYNSQYASGYSGASGTYQGHGTHSSYHGPIATPVVLPNGFLADTHEVAAAKGHHLQLLHSSQSEHHSVH